jgi:AmiR/NasT family two-component response regulator
MSASALHLEDLSVSVVCEPGAETELLVRELLRTRARVTRIWPLPQRLPEDYDVLVCDFTQALIGALPWVPGEANSALIAVLPPNDSYDVKLLRDCSPDAVLHRPFAGHMVVTSLVMARSQFLYFRRLQMRVARMDETLRATRDIERAKQILMTTRRMSEEEAYDCLRRNAMDRRLTIAAVATAIVDSQMVLG